MKLVYTNANRTLVLNVQNLLEQAGVKTLLRNEYAVGGMGELSPFDAWLEVWAVHDVDLPRARELAATAVSHKDAPSWRCNRCGEANDASFDFCWNCQHDVDALPAQHS